MSPVAPLTVNDVSYVSRTNHESHFSCRQHLLMLQCHFSQQEQHLVDFGVSFSGQAQHLVMSECHVTFRGRRSI